MLSQENHEVRALFGMLPRPMALTPRLVGLNLFWVDAPSAWMVSAKSEAGPLRHESWQPAVVPQAGARELF